MKNTISAFILLLSILFSNQSFSQASKGFKLLNERLYDKALSAFNEALQDEKQVTEARFGLSLLFSTKDYKKFNLAKAYTHIKTAEKKYAKLDKKKKDEINDKYFISKKTIEEQRDNCLNNAFDDAKQKNTVEAFNDFITNFKDSPRADEAIEMRNLIAFSEAEKKGTPAAYKNFMLRYPDAKQIPDAKQKYNNFFTEIYVKYTSDGEISTLYEFEQKYPDFPKDSNYIQEKNLAFKISKFALPEGFNKYYVENYIDYIKQAAPKDLAFVILQILISPSLYKKDWKSAIDTLKKYQPFFKNDTKISKLIDILSQKSTLLKVNEFSSKINSPFDDYSPVITADGNTMYFCRLKSPANLGGEDIFVSNWVNGEWSEPQLTNGINTSTGNEAPLSISFDGNRLLVFKDADIYYSDKTVDGWTELTAFPQINLPNTWEADAMITADGKAVLFSSDRIGNIGIFHPVQEEFHGSYNGNTDIYIATKNDDGTWNEPFNLGKAINTPYCERSPFLHPDMKSLYFSSDGHSGLGRLDVFKSVRLSDTSWTQWSEPVNLGKDINTIGNEYTYKISTDGKIAYFSGNVKNNSDVLYISLPKELQPEPVATISGKITDTNNKPIDATIKWEDLSTGKIIGYLKTDPANGNYFLTLPMGKLYGYYVEKKEFYPASGNIDLRNQKEEIHLKQDITLISISQILKKETSIPLKNLFFDYDKFDLKPESFPELIRLAEFIKNNENLSVEISGHTDNSGDAAYNQSLSENRAKSVKDYLIKQGCKPDKINSIGYGDKKPIEDNKTEQGKAKNRRVEFRVI